MSIFMMGLSIGFGLGCIFGYRNCKAELTKIKEELRRTKLTLWLWEHSERSSN